MYHIYRIKHRCKLFLVIQLGIFDLNSIEDRFADVDILQVVLDVELGAHRRLQNPLPRVCQSVAAHTRIWTYPQKQNRFKVLINYLCVPT